LFALLIVSRLSFLNVQAAEEALPRIVQIMAEVPNELKIERKFEFLKPDFFIFI